MAILSVNDVLELHKAGVPAEVIVAMVGNHSEEVKPEPKKEAQPEPTPAEIRQKVVAETVEQPPVEKPNAADILNGMLK